MCKMCEGATLDDCLIDLDLVIARHGWAVQGVEGNPTPRTYTIGLAGTFGHPELIVVGLAPERAHPLIEEAAERVRAGERLWGGERLELGAITVDVVDVHPDHFDKHSTFNMWWNYYRSLGSPTAEPSALQLRLPDNMFCSCHRQPWLDRKGSSVGHVMNRAARRAEGHGRKKRKRRQ